MNSIINMCYPYAEERRNVSLCGDYDIDLSAQQTNMTMNIMSLPLYTSCTYRVHTTCGYPQLRYFSTEDITNQFDIAYMYQDGLTAM
jgi:hypothetical protein